MSNGAKNHRIITILDWIASFILDRQATNKSPRTISFYTEKLNKFWCYCNAVNISRMEEITTDIIRHFLLWLAGLGHNAGGIQAHYRSVRAFVRWWVRETEPENFRDPFRNVQLPQVPDEALPPIPLAHVQALLAACPQSWHGGRDKAAILMLLDTGARADE